MANYNMHTNLKQPRNLGRFTLFRGTTDFTDMRQFDYYETGFPILIVIKMPAFLEKMVEKDTTLQNQFFSYKAIIEREFIGFDSGLDNITSETNDINNGLQSLNLITKVNAPSASSFSMTFRERSGSPITRMHELYLRSVCDPNTGFKTYNGLIGPKGSGAGEGLEPDTISLENEFFSFLYMHTDVTGFALERAVYLTCCQPTEAPLEIYSGKKGEIAFQDVSVTFNGLPIMGKWIDQAAQSYLDWLNDTSNKYFMSRISWDYNWYALKDIKTSSDRDTSANNTVDRRNNVGDDYDATIPAYSMGNGTTRTQMPTPASKYDGDAITKSAIQTDTDIYANY